MIRSLSIYLGSKTSNVVLPNGVKTWAFVANQYVQEYIAKYGINPIIPILSF